MSGSAQVRSTDAIQAVASALARFEQRVQASLDALDADVRRSEQWLEHDRPAYWRDQLRQAEDAVHQAKIDLERCLTFSTQERPSCREQKAALREAKIRLEYCREKSEAIKHWQRNFRHESLEFAGRLGQLRRMLEIDLPRARAQLAAILQRLDEYGLERAPAAFSALDTPSASRAPGGSTSSHPPDPTTTGSEEDE